MGPADTVDDETLSDLVRTLEGAVQRGWDRSVPELAEAMRRWGLDAAPAAGPRPRTVTASLRGDGRGPCLTLVVEVPAIEQMAPAAAVARSVAEQLAIAAMVVAGLQGAGGGAGGEVRFTAVMHDGEREPDVAGLLSESPRPDAAIVLADTGGRALVDRPGCLPLLLTTRGLSAWVGAQHRRPHVNAIDLMRRAIDVITGLEGRLADPGPGIRLVGAVGGFTNGAILARPAQHADFCAALLEVPYHSDSEREAALPTLRQALSPLTRGENGGVSVDVPMPAGGVDFAAHARRWNPVRLEAGHPILASFAAARSSVDGTADGQDRPAGWGSDTGRLLQASGIPTVDYGPPRPAGSSAAAYGHLRTGAAVLGRVLTQEPQTRQGVDP